MKLKRTTKKTRKMDRKNRLLAKEIILERESSQDLQRLFKTARNEGMML